jgi:hypothetical protein
MLREYIVVRTGLFTLDYLRVSLCRDLAAAFSASAGLVDVLAFLRAVEEHTRRLPPRAYDGSDLVVLSTIGTKLLSHVEFAVAGGIMKSLDVELQRRETAGSVPVVSFVAACDLGHISILDSDLAKICGMYVRACACFWVCLAYVWYCVQC